MIVRVNVALSQFVGHSEYSTQLGIAVPLQDPQSNGLPSPAEDRRLSRIEDELADLLTAGRASLFACVVTTAGMREFVFYTGDVESAVERVAQVQERHRNQELQVMHQADPAWDVFGQFA
jgi:hypothetical protein